jgi:hypothetical protein
MWPVRNCCGKGAGAEEGNRYGVEVARTAMADVNSGVRALWKCARRGDSCQRFRGGGGMAREKRSEEAKLLAGSADPNAAACAAIAVNGGESVVQSTNG